MTIAATLTYDSPPPVIAIDAAETEPVVDFRLHRHTLEETAKELGMTVEQVRQTEQRAIKKLKSDPQILQLWEEMKK